MKFFVGIDGTSANVKELSNLLKNRPVILSAASIWRGRWRPGATWMKTYIPDHVSEIWFDSGGYTFFSKWSYYPFSGQQYIEKAEAIGADYVSTLDYPCEPGIHSESNLDRIDRTVRNAREETRIRTPFQWVPVIQGFSLSEYGYCIETYGSLLDRVNYVAIGSMCHRRKRSEISELVRYLKRELSNHHLHGFGVDRRSLTVESVYNSLYSADSQAWRFDIPDKSQGHLFATRKEASVALSRYLEKIDSLHTGPLDSLLGAELRLPTPPIKGSRPGKNPPNGGETGK